MLAVVVFAGTAEGLLPVVPGPGSDGKSAQNLTNFIPDCKNGNYAAVSTAT
jgi:hypothetical protein